MFITTSRSIHVFNDKDVRMLIVVDDDPVDQRSQLIFLLELILINVLTIHVNNMLTNYLLPIYNVNIVLFVYKYP
jgi:hypothetical protein